MNEQLYKQKLVSLSKFFRMLKQFYFLVFLLFALNTTVLATDNDSIASGIFKLIYEQKLSEAESALKAGNDGLNDFYSLYLNLDLHWWKYRTSYSKDNARQLDELIQKSLLPETDSYEKKMRQIMVKSYQLRYAKKKFNLFSLLSARADIRDLIVEIEKEEPQFSNDQQKLFETFVIMYQYIENINFFANEKKSAERAKKLIRMEKFANENNVILYTVAHFFLARMNQKIEDQPEIGLQHYKILTAKYPSNQTFAEYQKECEEAL